MQQTKLILDFDNTLVNSTKAFIRVYNLIYGSRYIGTTDKIPAWDKVRKYDFTDEIPSLTSSMKHSIFNSPKFYEFLEFYPNAKESINRLSQDYTVEIVSICSPETVKMKADFISKHLPNCHFQPVLYGQFKDKSHINMENCIFIDDHAGNLITSNARVKICFKFQDINMDINKDWESIYFTSWEEQSPIFQYHNQETLREELNNETI